jgi:cytochrome oxidase assembly protein ShyY1
MKRTHARQNSHAPSNTSTGLVSVTAVLRVLSSIKMLGLHLFAIVLVVTMVNLGFWQLRRHEERVTFNDAVRARAQTAPLSPDALLALDTDTANLEWYPLQASGEYLADENLLLVNVSQDGRAGVDPVSALRLDDGRILLVNRGFVPLASAVPAPPSGRVSVVGRARASDERRRGQLGEKPGELREIQRIDIPRLAPQLPGDVLPVYVDLLASDPADSATLSRIADPELTLGPHLSYTVQWFVFSACAVVGWGFIVRRALAAARQAGPST